MSLSSYLRVSLVHSQRRIHLIWMQKDSYCFQDLKYFTFCLLLSWLYRLMLYQIIWVFSMGKVLSFLIINFQPSQLGFSCIYPLYCQCLLWLDFLKLYSLRYILTISYNCNSDKFCKCCFNIISRIDSYSYHQYSQLREDQSQ